MRIVVNDIAASTGGALTVLKEFYDCIRVNDRENEWIFLLGEDLLEETDNIKIRVLKDVKASGLKKLWFDFIAGKKYIRGLQPDVVLSMQNIITFGLKVPQVVYIHQPIPFQKTKRFSFFKKNEHKLAVYQYIIGRIIKRSAKKSCRVIVQTKWMQDAVCESCSLSREKVVRVLPNVKNIKVCANAGDLQKDQFFYPTSEILYKNVVAIKKASAALVQEGVEHKVSVTLPKEDAQENICYIGKIPYDEVLAYYQKATLIFPSYIETFGYPLAEARKVGTVILAADTPFARELLEGYENGYFFDPFRPEELAELMKKVITGDITRKEVRDEDSPESDSWLDVLELVKAQGL